GVRALNQIGERPVGCMKDRRDRVGLDIVPNLAEVLEGIGKRPALGLVLLLGLIRSILLLLCGSDGSQTLLVLQILDLLRADRSRSSDHTRLRHIARRAYGTARRWAGRLEGLETHCCPPQTQNEECY